MATLFRAVLDTNVYVAAVLTSSARSPNAEVLRRWTDGEFVLLIADPILEEITEKLHAKGVSPERTVELVSRLDLHAEKVTVDEVPAVVAADPDDDVILACAVDGGADYLVTYDPHLLDLGAEYGGVQIVEALPFLWALRGDELPGEDTAGG
ncbi:MAG: putative toxin-antitoxin system toxin component, PIN family [Chloroflexi bacterium]|nr:putative toxin-antitoxin system toxin component, PIN family [Chloroflexota bacterium]